MGPNDDQVIHAFDAAPAPIQHSLSDGEAVDFIEKLSSRYGLHVDTVGYVATFIRNMLLGFLKPEQFMQKLESIGIAGEKASTLTSDLNREVFIPLRDEIRNSKGKVEDVSPSAIPQVGVMQVAAAMPEPAKAPVATVFPVAQAASVSPPSATVPLEAVQAAMPPVSAPVPTYAAATAVPITPHIAEPAMRTMQSDMQALQSQPPYQQPNAAQSIPFTAQAEHATPARAFQTASLPNVSSFSFSAMPTAPSTPQRSSNDLPIEHSYGSDPYREPI